MKLQISRLVTQWLIHQKSIDGNKPVGKIIFTHPTNPVILLFNEELIVQIKQINEIIKVALISNGQTELHTTIKQGRQLNKFTWIQDKDPSLNVQVIQKNNQYIAKQKGIKIAQVTEISSTVSVLEIKKEKILKTNVIMGCFAPFFF
ncbi:MAG: hypothetical protein ACTSO7_00890 [Candidatus Heimdallarchaeota archaeon]